MCIYIYYISTHTNIYIYNIYIYIYIYIDVEDLTLNSLHTTLVFRAEDKAVERAQPYSAATNRCRLCIGEKYFILKTRPSLNKRSEIFSSCPHRKKHLLQNYQWPGNEKKKKNNNTRSERQPNTPLSYPKRTEGMRHLCPPLATPVSYEEN